jgi:hypothetical protein
MSVRQTVPLLAVALTALAAAGARADAGWSGAAQAGLAFVQRGDGVSSGGWIELLHSVASNASAGLEAGYIKLPASASVYTIQPWYGTTSTTYSTFSASGAFRVRRGWGARLHALGTFGYYDLVTRENLLDGSDQVEHTWNPGFSLGIGVSGSGRVRPGFQLRWHEFLGPDDVNIDIVSFEVGLHFN